MVPSALCAAGSVLDREVMISLLSKQREVMKDKREVMEVMM